VSAIVDVVAGGPVVPSRQRRFDTARWGVLFVILTEAMIFLILISSWFFLRASITPWPPPGIDPPELPRISVFTVVLLASSGPMVWAERAIRRGDHRGLRLGLAASWVLGAAFLVNQVYDYATLPCSPTESAYGSMFILITGLHGLHVAGGLLISSVVQVKAWTRRFSAGRHLNVTVLGLYWHFVDVVWIAVFSSLYLGEHIR
jgi:heme/copper-type cytochrome/quinol oxidase subunit 3